MSNNHLPFCDSEAATYTNFLSALVDDGDTGQGIVSRNDLVAVWDEYAGSQKPEGKLLVRYRYLLERSDTRYDIIINGKGNPQTYFRNI